ncbi:MOSC domain-containing protein [Hymenobacter sp. HMF4947]|uniref:MOSC domain-containing protein n=1 Tax=Hymenobacter ginkgonis TaxID=2682976 RepID=A0A7K1TH75_9BACT|nr:MOSC domain-containing protein [Hymenobacter ginkgonis]MVN77765.1 MOSC domain-containing protein [Hymenobacter ginkgonis]
MHVLSVNTALPQDFSWQGQVLRTSIFKQPVAGPVRVYAEHLAGDGQADLRVHGGRDKAVYAYPLEHHAYWQQFVPVPRLVPGAFGENLTTVGLLEDQVRVGDHFLVGTAVLVAQQPRQPCVKLGFRLQDASLVRRFGEARRSGIYFRVHREGTLQAGDAITLLHPSAYAVTIQDMAEVYAPGPKDRAKLEAIHELPMLSASWRERVARLLEAAEPQ